MKKTLKRELKEHEIATREPNNAWLVLICINSIFIYTINYDRYFFFYRKIIQTINIFISEKVFLLLRWLISYLGMMNNVVVFKIDLNEIKFYSISLQKTGDIDI